jgi:hypothetical protein
MRVFTIVICKAATMKYVWIIDLISQRKKCLLIALPYEILNNNQISHILIGS